MNNEEDTCEQESTAAALYGKGLSPRVRGNLCDEPVQALAEQSILACTGNLLRL